MELYKYKKYKYKYLQLLKKINGGAAILQFTTEVNKIIKDNNINFSNNEKTFSKVFYIDKNDIGDFIKNNSRKYNSYLIKYTENSKILNIDNDDIKTNLDENFGIPYLKKNKINNDIQVILNYKLGAYGIEKMLQYDDQIPELFKNEIVQHLQKIRDMINDKRKKKI